MDDDKLHYPAIIAMDGQSGLVDCDIKIRVSYGGPLPPEPRPTAPPQIAATKTERADLGRELRELAQQIEELLRDDYPLSPYEASERSGLGQDWQAVLDWRMNLEQELRAMYLADIRPRVIDTYERARERGFFDADLEENYRSRVLMIVEKFPAWLRRAAAR